MSHLPSPIADEVDQLLLNAQLRDDLEPYIDDSMDLLTVRQMPLATENEFLQSILAWERAPALPISRWFTPELILPRPDELSDSQVRKRLTETIQNLYLQRIVLEMTEHLSDRQLYCLISRDILPSYEKKIDHPKNYLHWHCLDDNDSDTWLRYYASDDERDAWQEENGGELPLKDNPPHPRKMPRRSNGM
ncbi:MAG: hypothetical protein SGI77_05060 [Pirellulaceae bacterium]|nr:hypothetical protein [Pirellulaceae bacterium]